MSGSSPYALPALGPTHLIPHILFHSPHQWGPVIPRELGCPCVHIWAPLMLGNNGWYWGHRGGSLNWHSTYRLDSVLCGHWSRQVTMTLSQKQQHEQELSSSGGPGWRRCKDAQAFLHHDMCVGRGWLRVNLTSKRWTSCSLTRPLCLDPGPPGCRCKVWVSTGEETETQLRNVWQQEGPAC